MIRLDYRDARPIYEQVKDGLRRLMVTGAAGTGGKAAVGSEPCHGSWPSTPTPSNGPMRQLEMEGYVYSVAGRGTFVAEGQEQNLVRRREVEDKVQPLVQELRELGMTEGEWIALWRGGNENA